MGIQKIALDKIKSDSDLRAKMMLVPFKASGKGASEYTIKRWIEANDDNLTKPKYTAVIMEHTGLTIDQILETEKAEA